MSASGGSTTVSISGVKIEKGLEADIMQMFKCFIRRGKTRTLLILSGSCDKMLKRKKDVFVLILHISLVVLKHYPLYKPYYA